MKGFLDVFTKSKHWILNRNQGKVLKFYDKIIDKPLLEKWFTRISRFLIGGFIYSIKIEVNNYCQLKCKMCYLPKLNKPPKDLPMKVLNKLFSEISQYRIRIEILGGEPLLRKDIADVIYKAKHLAKSPYITLYTNGINATQDVSRKLKDAGLDGIIVTMISHKKEVHDSFTEVPGSWEKTIEGIENLKNAGIKVFTFSAIHKENFKDYKALYYFLKEDLKVHPLFYQYVPQQKDDPLIINKKDWSEIKHWILYEKETEHMNFVRNFYMLNGNACSGGNFVFTVKVDGTVQPCPFVDDIPLGNIYKNDIWYIFKHRFNNPELKTFKDIPASCSNCTYKSVCSGGCPAGNKILFGRYDQKDIRCLGPFNSSFDKEKVIDCVPTFF